MFKIRVVGEEGLREFGNRDDAFGWVRGNLRPNTMFCMLEYDERGNLEVMNRFLFNGKRFMIENITK